MKQVTILSGASGSGKSTYVTEVLSSSEPFVCSADHFFIGIDNVYRFDPSQLGAAHGQCFRTFIGALQDQMWNHVVVDNTNTTIEEISPYVLGAQAFGYGHVIVRVTTQLSVDELVARNRHGVGHGAIRGQLSRLDRLELPPWWNTQVYTPSV